MSFLGFDILWAVALAVLLINIPFGFWRAAVRKFSPAWFGAVHIPIPIAVGLRLVTHLGWHASVIATMAGCFFAGQFLGGRLHRIWNS